MTVFCDICGLDLEDCICDEEDKEIKSDNSLYY